MAESFRENLRAELDYQDLTVKELCARTGIPKATLECYLGARANMPSADAAFRIARALGVTVEYLITGRDAPAGEAWIMNGKNRELMRLIGGLDGTGWEVVAAVARTLRKLQEKAAR